MVPLHEDDFACPVDLNAKAKFAFIRLSPRNSNDDAAKRLSLNIFCVINPLSEFQGFSEVGETNSSDPISSGRSHEV